MHYTTLQLQLHYLTLHYTRLHYTIPNYSTQHYSTLQYTTLITPHHSYNCNCNCNYTTLITPHYNYNSTTLRYNYDHNYNCTAPHYIQQLRWGDHCKHCNHSKKHNSNHLSVHQWIRSAIRDSQQPTSPVGFLFLKLPPPPCAVLGKNCYHWYVFYLDISWQPLIHTKEFKIIYMLVHHHHHTFFKPVFNEATSNSLRIESMLVKWFRLFSWPTFAITWIIIINTFACCNIPFCCCCCFYNRITRFIFKKIGDVNSRRGEQDEQCMMDCHAVSSGKQQLIIHFIDSVGDHPLYLEPMKDVGMVSVNPMLCMTWTQQVRTLLPPHPPPKPPKMHFVLRFSTARHLLECFSML